MSAFGSPCLWCGRETWNRREPNDEPLCSLGCQLLYDDAVRAKIQFDAARRVKRVQPCVGDNNGDCWNPACEIHTRS